MKDMFKLHVFPHTAFVVIIYYLVYKRIACGTSPRIWRLDILPFPVRTQITIEFQRFAVIL